MEKQLPKYNEMFIPVLKVLNDAGIIHYAELERRVRDEQYHDLPKELLEQKIKSGHLSILNRIGWAKVYLKQAEMVTQPQRAMVQITEKGKRILALGHLTLKELLADQDFIKNQLKKTIKKEAIDEIINENSSPEEMIDSGVDSIESQVKSDLLEKLRAINPYYFEKVVLKLFSAMGYGDFIITSKSGDGGIDGIINQDQLGARKDIHPNKAVRGK